MQPNDHQLRLFVAVARARSLRHAAQALQVTQPALSKQIRALESVLPGPLFRRDGRGMELTALGRQLFDDLAHSYSLVDAAFETVAGAGSTTRFQVSIATINTLAMYLLPNVVVRVRESLPDVGLSIETGSSPEVVDRVERGRADLGLVYDSAVDSDAFGVHPLYTEKLCAYRARNPSGRRSLSPEELRSEPIILPPQPYVLRRAVERALGGALKAPLECNSVSLSLDLASRRLGIAILPEYLPDESIGPRGLEKVEIFGGRLCRPVVAITSKNSRLSEAALDALSAVKACVARLPTEM